jgi:hypothetical protein
MGGFSFMTRASPVNRIAPFWSRCRSYFLNNSLPWLSVNILAHYPQGVKRKRSQHKQHIASLLCGTMVQIILLSFLSELLVFLRSDINTKDFWGKRQWCACT